MKNLICFIVFVFSLNVLQAQTYTLPQSINNVPNGIVNTNAIKGKVIMANFSDTSAANAENILKNYTGAYIYTTTDSSTWYRIPNKWIKILPSGSVTAPEAWLTQGNTISPFSPVIRLGTANAYELPIQTNGVRRLTVPVDGLKRTSAPLYKYVMIDTSGAEHYLAYGDGGGSGGSTLTSIGSGYAVGVTGTNNVKSIKPYYGIVVDSTVSGEVGIRVDSTELLGQFWGTRGNTNTTAGTNFIGTTDSVDFVGKTNNTEQIRLLASGGIRIPTTVDSTIGVIFKGSDRFIHNFYLPGTLGQNLFIGKKAGNFTMTGSAGGFGTRNLSIGDSTLFANTTGYRNVAIGINAGAANTTGYENTAVGANAHEKNNTGRQNTAIGAISMQTNTTGERNAALGFSALQFNLTGTRNVAAGGRAMQFVQTGDANVAVGFDALAAYNSSANHNVAVGLDALYYSGGSNNVAVGDSTLWGLYGSLIPHLGYKNVAVGSRAGYHLGDTYPNFASIYDTACIFLGGNTSRDSSIPYTTSLQNMTVIGYDARGTASNQVTLGNNNVTSTLLKGSLNARGYGSGTHTGTATYNAAFDASGNIIEVASSGGTVTGTVSNNTIAKGIGGTAIGNSGLSDDGTNVTSSEHFIPSANNAKDLGLTGTVWRSAYIGTSLNAPNIVSSTNLIQIAPNTLAGNKFNFTSSQFTSPVNVTVSAAGAASTPAQVLSGTWFTGGSSTTTKPQLLIEPTGTTSTAWSTSGTGLGVNAPSGFTGNLINAQLNGVSKVQIRYDGTYISTGPVQSPYWLNTGNNVHLYGASTGTGALTVYDGGETGASIIQMGGTGTANPGLFRNGTGIDVKLADNSAYTNIGVKNLTLNTAGSKITVTTGSNASAGLSGAMTAGTITISTTAVTASSLIFLTAVGSGTGQISLGTVTAGTSFVINSSDVLDSRQVQWWIIN